jgi:DNA-binding LytR/AlgR family response regulator
MIKSLIQLAARSSVQPAWDRWFGRRDEQPGTSANGEVSWTGGVGTELSIGAVYTIVASLVVASAIVSTFSAARDVSWRLATPHNLWEPALWIATGSIVVLALLPLVRRGGMLLRIITVRPLAAGAGFIVLALAFSALQIIGMGLLRELAYRAVGLSYVFPWSHEILYELRKDLFSYFALAVIFWFAERPAAVAPAPTDEDAPKLADGAPARADLWLRDGRMSLLIDPCEIVSVTSAGNYVEYQLTDRRTHLIRATLQAEEARLAPFGIVRVHRTRLLNVRRIVALEWRPSGDFEVRLDTGETVFGSRRFKAAAARLADRSTADAAAS